MSNKITSNQALVVISLFFISCGPSAQEQAAVQKKHDDSLATVVEFEVRKKAIYEEDSLKTALEAKHKEEDVALTNAVKTETISNVNAINLKQKQVVEGNQIISKLNSLLDQAKANLAVADNRYNSDKGFHLGRLASTRDAQIRSDVMSIQSFQRQIQQIQQRILEVNTKIAQLKSEIANNQL